MKTNKAAFMNPLVVYPRKNQGKIAAYMGLSRDTAPHRHDPDEVTGFIKSASGIPGGTLIAGVGFYEGGQEHTVQIVFVNGGRYAMPTFAAFRALVQKFVHRLAKRFGQRIVLLEELRPDGTYRISEWDELSAYATKAAKEKEKRLLRKMVRSGIAEAVYPGV